MSALVLVLSRGSFDPSDAVERGLAAAPHRGSGATVSRSGRAALGVTRGDGPAGAWIHEADGLLLAVAGRIDNAEEIAKDLGDDAGDVAIGSPAAIVHRAFRLRGERAISPLRGAFEGAVTDGERAWVFRDHFGFRPMFVRSDGRAFIAATEAKQVVAAADIPLEPNVDVLEAILFGEYDDATPAALAGVGRLPKASIAKADRDGARVRRYWDPHRLIETARDDAQEVRDRFDDLMLRATSRTLTGDDLVSLSGGLDSPTVAAFAAPEHVRRFGEPLPALSAVYPDQPSVDESPWIEAVAGALGMPLHTFERRAAPLAGLQEWVRLFDGPVPTLVVNDAKEHYEHVRAVGKRTMLTGELAEFLVDQRRYLAPHLLRRGRLGALARLYRVQRGHGVSAAAFGRQLALAYAPKRLEVARLLKRQTVAGGAGVPAWIDADRVHRAEAAFARRARDRWAASQLAALEGPGLNMEADEILQELCGVMTRRPWADVDLFEFFLSLPAEVKYQGERRKDIVRWLMRGRVPDVVLDRPTKTLFNASIMARIEYRELDRWLVDPPTRLPNVRYDLLADRLRSQDLSLLEYQWAKDLAAVQAFLALW
jgi:asparagine synthase (glutamine-hydrolysing)